jgi:hypothetical protein
MQEAKKVVDDFYQTNQNSHPEGALNLAQLLAFRQFISVPLFELLKDVSEAEEAHQNAADNKQAPLVEGNLLTALPYGATSYRIINCQLEFEKGFCRVELSYQDVNHPTPIKWVDKVVLSTDIRGWVVANIVYAGGNPPMRTGSLHETLLQTLKNDPSINPEDYMEYEQE